MPTGRVRHWKHGWIPVSAEAKAFVAGTGPRPVTPRSGRRKGPSVHRVKANTSPQPDMIKEIRENGGFTYDPKTGGLLRVGEASGYAVAVPGTEHVIGEEKVNADDISREDFARGVADVLMKHRDAIANGAVLGGWYSPERNQFMVELSQILPANDREGAIRVGQERNQEAIFDLATGETIVTGGTGDAGMEDKFGDLGPDPESLSATTAALAPEEKLAVKFYSGPGFNPLNGGLRRGERLAPQVDFYRQRLDGALSKSVTKKSATVFRGMRSYPSFPGHFNPGSTLTDAGYMSTAVSDGPPENYKADVMLEIDVPKGAHALDMHGARLTHHAEEHELLLPRNTQLRIRSDTMVFGQRVIKAEVVI